MILFVVCDYSVDWRIVVDMWMDQSIDGSMVRWMDDLIDVQVDGCVHEFMNAWMHANMDACMDALMGNDRLGVGITRNKSTNLSHTQSINKSINYQINHSIDQPFIQSINKPNDKYITSLVCKMTFVIKISILYFLLHL